MAQDWTAKLNLNPEPYLNQLRRVEGQSAKVGEQVKKSFDLGAIWRMAGGAAVFTTAVYGINILTEKLAYNQARAAGDAEAMLRSQLGMRDALGDMVSSVPIIGQGLRAAFESITNRAAWQAGLDAVQTMAKLFDSTAAQVLKIQGALTMRTATIEGAPQSEMLRLGREAEAKQLRLDYKLRKQLLEDQEEAISKLRGAEHAAAMQKHKQDQEILRLLRERIEALETVAWKEYEAARRLEQRAAKRQLKGFIGTDEEQAIAALNEEYRSALEVVEKLTTVESTQAKIRIQLLDAYNRKLKTIREEQEEARARQEAEEQRRLERITAERVRHENLRLEKERTVARERERIVEQFVRRAMELERDRMRQAESFEDRWFRIQTAGLTEEGRKLQAGFMAGDIRKRAERAYSGGDIEEARRLLEKQQDYLEQAGRLPAMRRTQQVIQRLYREQQRIEARRAQENITRLSDIEDRLARIQSAADIRLELDTTAARAELDDLLVQFNRAFGPVELPRQAVPGARGVQGATGASPVSVGAINVNVTQKLDRGDIRSVIVDELRRLRSRGRL